MTGIDLARVSPQMRAAYLEAYSLGYRDGIDRGRQQLEDEWRGRMEVSASIARQIAAAGPYDELEERRGRPDRADAHRRHLAERGVSA